MYPVFGLVPSYVELARSSAQGITIQDHSTIGCVPSVQREIDLEMCSRQDCHSHDMLPLVGWNKVNDIRYAISNESLELVRISRKPVEYHCAVSPSEYFT